MANHLRHLVLRQSELEVWLVWAETASIAYAQERRIAIHPLHN